MIHIRVDDEPTNDRRRFACGIGPKLPPGDLYFFESEVGCNQFKMNRVDCPGCNPAGVQPIGVPLSQLSGQPGSRGHREFVRVAESWGYP